MISSENYRYSTNRQVVIDADTRLVVAVGRPLPGNRNDCGAWEDSGPKAAAGTTGTVIADGGYRGTGLTGCGRAQGEEGVGDPLVMVAAVAAGQVVGESGKGRGARHLATSSRGQLGFRAGHWVAGPHRWSLW